MFSGAPFLLGKLLRSDDDTDVAAKDDAVSAAAAASVVPGTSGASSGFWALPARPDFGQVWSFAAGSAAAAASVVPGTGGVSSGFWALPARPNFGQVWSFAAGTDMLFSAPERGGSYLPIGQGHLNLLASLSGAAGSAGRGDDESH